MDTERGAGSASHSCRLVEENLNASDTGRAPTEVYRFYVLWLVGMLIGAAYDLMVAVAGDFEEATIDILNFLGAAVLLFCTTHQRTNLARCLWCRSCASQFGRSFRMTVR